MKGRGEASIDVVMMVERRSEAEEPPWAVGGAAHHDACDLDARTHAHQSIAPSNKSQGRDVGRGSTTASTNPGG